VSASEIKEHIRYLTDERKLEAYGSALRAVVPAGGAVLDLGCGTGLLGLLACDAGAGRVYAVDAGSVIGLAREIAEAAGYADRITYIEAHSAEIDLPEQVDVVVADQIGGLAYEPGVLEYYADARRFLKPSGVFVPQAFDLGVCPVQSEESWAAVGGWRSRTDLFGGAFARVSAYAASTVFSTHLGPDDCLGPSAWFAHTPSWRNERMEGAATVTIDRRGTLHGLAGIFRAHMAPGVTMTNDPTHPERMRHRWVSFLPLADPITVEPGDQVNAQLMILPASYFASWTTIVRRGVAVLADERHSTFDGMFLTPRVLRNSSTRRPVARRRRLVLADALALAERASSVDELASELHRRHPDDFATVAAATRFADRFDRLLDR
jgi:protein arginine N-methyltransferase 1